MQDNPLPTKRPFSSTQKTLLIVGCGLALALLAWSFSLMRTGSQPAIPQSAQSVRSNPLPDSAAIQAGRQLYVAQCAPCHGDQGRGDGPLAVGLRPAPSDLAQHMRPGKHTDEQIERWISAGIPGTTMLAWKDRLDETEIRQVVQYLRTFGQASASEADDAREPLPPLIFAHQDNLWRSDGTGAPSTQITKLEAGQYAQHPAIAPDGRRIAFVVVTPAAPDARDPLPASGLYVMAPDGSHQRPIWRQEHALLGVTGWNRDGTAIYVAVTDLQYNADTTITTRTQTVMRVDLASGAAAPILGDALDPAIAPDGTRIAYLRFSPSDGLPMSVYVANADGGDNRMVLDGLYFEGFHTPRFSPDSTHIIISARGGPPTDADGYPIPPQAPSAGAFLRRLFAPAVAEAHGGAWELWQVDLDQGRLRRLTNFAEDDPVAAFSPDGTQIAILGRQGMYLMDADGGRLRKIADLSGDGGLVWLPR